LPAGRPRVVRQPPLDLVDTPCLEYEQHPYSTRLGAGKTGEKQRALVGQGVHEGGV